MSHKINFDWVCINYYDATTLGLILDYKKCLSEDALYTQCSSISSYSGNAWSLIEPGMSFLPLIQSCDIIINTTLNLNL